MLFHSFKYIIWQGSTTLATLHSVTKSDTAINRTMSLHADASHKMLFLSRVREDQSFKPVDILDCISIFSTRNRADIIWTTTSYFTFTYFIILKWHSPAANAQPPPLYLGSPGPLHTHVVSGSLRRTRESGGWRWKRTGWMARWVRAVSSNSYSIASITSSLCGCVCALQFKCVIRRGWCGRELNRQQYVEHLALTPHHIQMI